MSSVTFDPECGCSPGGSGKTQILHESFTNMMDFQFCATVILQCEHVNASFSAECFPSSSLQPFQLNVLLHHPFRKAKIFPGRDHEDVTCV
jgi:hypothetical protein